MPKKRTPKGKKPLVVPPESEVVHTVRVMHPGGRVETMKLRKSEFNRFPQGTMLQWSEGWTVIGTSWPFDE